MILTKLVFGVGILVVCFIGCIHTEHPHTSHTLQSSPQNEETNLPAHQQSPTFVDAPSILFAATEYDFGIMHPGTYKTATFDFINAGGHDLILEQIRSCCGVAAQLPKDQIIAPGQVSEISVTYLASISPSIQKKKIILLTNDPHNREIALWVKATIPASESAVSVNPLPVTAASPPQLDSLSKPTRHSIDYLKRAIGR